MLGAICGDVIGSVYEWHNVKTEDFNLFSRESHFTDDTVMTAAVMDKLLSGDNSHGFFKNREAALEYAARFRQYYHRYSDAGFGSMFADWAKSTTNGCQKSYGNGAAMRVTPIGYAFDTLKEVLLEATISCRYTHNNPEAVKGARAVAGSVFLAHHGAGKEEIRSFVRREAGYRLDVRLEQIRPDYIFDSRTSYSVPPAIQAFLESSSFEDALRKAISIGGDSDTIACITGGIAEAFYKAIPKEIADKTLLRLDSGLRQLIKAFYERFNQEGKI